MSDDKVIAFAGRVGFSRPSGYIGEGNFGPTGPGDGGGMEAKIARLETQMAHVQSDLSDVKSRVGKVEERLGTVEVSLATLVERVSHLPSKEYMVKIALGTVAFLTAISLFSEKIRTLVGL